MTRHLLAIDDVEDDFEMILKWAVEFKRLWKEGDDVAVNFMPLDTWRWGQSTKSLAPELECHSKSG